MRILKSFVAAFMCVILVLSITACGNKEEKKKDNNDKGNKPQSVVTTTPEEIGPSASVAETLPGTVNNQIPGAVGEYERVDSSYFDTAAFVGDSVSLKLSYYAAATGDLGNAQFFASGSLGSANALWEISDESVHPTFQGEKMLVEDCIAASGANTVYIMLGMNDLGLYGLEDTLVNFETLMDKILEKSPSVQINVQSMTPMTNESYILGDSLNNETIKEYNRRLCEMCERRSWFFIDVASVMYDANGTALNRDYCSDPDDMGVHFTEAGCDEWIEYLKTHAVHYE